MRCMQRAVVFVQSCVTIAMLRRVDAGVVNSFCKNADGAFECLYPCGASVVGGFDCAAKNTTWTCEATFGGTDCKYSTHCVSRGLHCNATHSSAWTECDSTESAGPPYDGGCGCGCASSACPGGAAFAQPPIDPNNPFVEHNDVFGFCIKKPMIMYTCNASAAQGRQCTTNPQGTLTHAQCAVAAAYPGCNEML